MCKASTLSNSNLYAQGLGAPAQTATPNHNAPQTGFHLYHFPASLCSQKCQWALEEKGVAYESHKIMLPLYEQYDPDYVRINPRCVVPALVEAGCVTTDSENIVARLDAEYGTPNSLTPAAEAEAMVQWVEKADALFIEALTYSDITPEGVPDSRPFLARKGTKGQHEHKIELLTELAAQYQDDAYLQAAYKGKLAILEGTGQAVNDATRMAAMHADTQAVLLELDQQLREGPFQGEEGFLVSSSFSLADLHWGVVLNRLELLGMIGESDGAVAWGWATPTILQYLGKLQSRPAFRRGVAGYGMVGMVATILSRKLWRFISGWWTPTIGCDNARQ